MKVYLSILIACLPALTACKKSGMNEPALAPTALTAKVNAWLNAQQYPAAPERNQAIRSLTQYLDFSGLYTEELNNGEKFILVPVKPGFKTVNNKTKHPLNTLVLIEDRNGKIRDGKIMQFVPETGATPAKLPVNTFHSIYNSLPVEAGGTFTALAVWDQYMYDLVYKDGKLNAFKMMKSREGSNRTTGCIDWYMVTTLYIDGVLIDQTYEYVGTTCNGCTPQDPTLEGVSCGGVDGEAGSNGGSYYEPVSKQVQWMVKADATANWYVESYELLQGVKPGSPVVPYFTAISHQSDAIFNGVSSSNPFYSTWQKLAVSTVVHNNGGTASCTISGKVTCAGLPDNPVSNAKGWTAVTEFP